MRSKILNVLVTDEASLTVKLGDFGLACSIGNADDYEQVGTKCYMAPEQFMHRRVGYAVDLWATGVLLYELICGRRPFCSDNEVSEQQHEPAVDLHHPEVVYEVAVFQRKKPSTMLVGFLKGLLDPSARRRLTADEALQHDYFTQQPAPDRNVFGHTRVPYAVRKAIN